MIAQLYDTSDRLSGCLRCQSLWRSPAILYGWVLTLKHLYTKQSRTQIIHISIVSSHALFMSWMYSRKCRRKAGSCERVCSKRTGRIQGILDWQPRSERLSSPGWQKCRLTHSTRKVLFHDRQHVPGRHAAHVNTATYKHPLKQKILPSLEHVRCGQQTCGAGPINATFSPLTQTERKR